jgi:hypothetical protein
MDLGRVDGHAADPGGLAWYFSRVGWDRASVIAGAVGLPGAVITGVASYLLPAPQPPSPPAGENTPRPPGQSLIGTDVGGNAYQISGVGASGRTAVELQAKSRHTSLRTLGRYVNPGPELAARVTAETNPAARRRN